MRRAILRGYYGWRNAGDDAFLAVCAWGARELLGCDRIASASHQVSMTYGARVRPLYWDPYRYRGFWRLNRWSERRAGRGADLVLFGGGSVFTRHDVIEVGLRAVAEAPSATCCAIGVSIGPFRDAATEAACARLLGRLAFVGVRDRVSLERGRALAPDTRIELTFDLAPLLARAAGAEVDAAGARGRHGLGIALCDLERFVGGDPARSAERVGRVAEAVRRCAARGLLDEVLLIDFNGHGELGDRAVHVTLADRIGAAVPVRHVPYASNPLAVMRGVAGLRGIVAMRLHAAVFAFCTRTPALVLGYHEKCSQWAEMIGAPAELVMDATSSGAEELAMGIGRLLEGTPPQPTLTPEEAEGRALGNWAWARPWGHVRATEDRAPAPGSIA